MIDSNIHTEIMSSLRKVEASENVRVLFACESGSRAWGFPSRDSDYDVRFVYIRPKDWYLSIDLEQRRDVIECTLHNSIDLSGWDIRKALRLLRKSNPPLVEWLNSPIIYVDSLGFAAKLRSVLPNYYAPAVCIYHYLHMARGNFREYLRGDVVWVKKYFYVLRPLLAIKWIEAGRGVVPMEFDVLVETMVENPDTKQHINGLLERKRAGEELDTGPAIPAISQFIETELSRLETVSPEKQAGGNDPEELNMLFRETLESAWDRAQ